MLILKIHQSNLKSPFDIYSFHNINIPSMYPCAFTVELNASNSVDVRDATITGHATNVANASVNIDISEGDP